MQIKIVKMHTLFLSTLSLRRATSLSIFRQAPAFYFYPRSPCGERPGIVGNTDVTRSAFLSTLSLRRATFRRGGVFYRHADFYPRSPCGERQQKCGNRKPDVDFYPRSPCGERRVLGGRLWHGEQFLSTLSLRRATCGNAGIGSPITISIHALLAESDVNEDRYGQQYWRFLSTLSLRRATINTYHRIFGEGISIHALLAESDQKARPNCQSK